MTTTVLTNKLRQGFTLIELLVVIAILGVLAAALLATLDPLEQIRRGQDTQKKEVASEFVAAVARYYTTRAAYPWDGTGANPPGDGCNGAALPSSLALGSANMMTGATSCVGYIIAAGELKSSFQQQPTTVTNLIYITQPAAGGDVFACFDPASKAQDLDKNTAYTQAGGTGANCISYGGAGNTSRTCYWCAK